MIQFVMITLMASMISQNLINVTCENKMKKRYQNQELQSAYERAVQYLTEYGNTLFYTSPNDHSNVPEQLKEKMGVVMAITLWLGVHSKPREDCPFRNDWPVYAIWQAGREWLKYQSYKEA